ncbi:hypothetical protein M5689_006278 [Euphorbia peplus]|nr:hypothetical protein M5689_006278 [Euphorbia peplus]
MPTFGVSFEAMLRYVLFEIDAPEPRFDFEIGRADMHVCRVFYTFRDEQGHEYPLDICGTSSVGPIESKRAACQAALKALQRLHGLQIVDFNHPRLETAKMEYVSYLNAYLANVVVPYARLLKDYNSYKKKLAAMAQIVTQLQPIVSRIVELF